MYPVRIAPKAASPRTHDIDLWHACFIPEVRVELLWQLKFGQLPLRRRRNVTASGVNSSGRSRGGLMQMIIIVSPRCRKNEVNAKGVDCGRPAAVDARNAFSRSHAESGSLLARIAGE